MLLTKQILLGCSNLINTICVGSDKFVSMHLSVPTSEVSAWIVNAFWFFTAWILSVYKDQSRQYANARWFNNITHSKLCCGKTFYIHSVFKTNRWENADMFGINVEKENINSELAIFYFSKTILTPPGTALKTMSDLKTNISDGFTAELLQKQSAYRNSLYPHYKLMASLNGEPPSDAVMM